MPTIHSLYPPHSRQKPLDDELRDDLRPARGILNGLGLSLVFWVVILVLAALCFGAWADMGPL
jgi:hypothetical protein